MGSLNSGNVTNRSCRAKQLIRKCNLRNRYFLMKLSRKIVFDVVRTIESARILEKNTSSIRKCFDFSGLYFFIFLTDRDNSLTANRCYTRLITFRPLTKRFF